MGRKRAWYRVTQEELLVPVDDDRFDLNMYDFGCEATRLRGHVDLRSFAAWDIDDQGCASVEETVYGLESVGISEHGIAGRVVA